MTAIEMKNIRRIYSGRTVLDINHLEIEEGERVALVGPNGSGKTTLLSIMALLAPPDNGTVKIYGEQVDWRFPEKSRSKITIVTQEPYFFSCSLKRNLAFGLNGRGLNRAEINKRIIKYIDLLGLNGFEKRFPRTFSSGEKKRAAIARALCLDTPIILLDEPFAHIDSQSAGILNDVLKKMERSRTMVFSTHELVRAYNLADRIITLHEGKISPWTPENIYTMTARIIQDGTELSTSGGLAVYFPHNLDENRQYKVSINAREVIISKQLLESSAQNRFKGIVRKIEAAGEHLVEFTIDCPPDLPVKATVTGRTVRAFGCTVGDEVWVSFKSAAVHVFGSENNGESSGVIHD